MLKRIFDSWLPLVFVGIVLISPVWGADSIRVEPSKILESGYDDEFCWSQTRASASPSGEAVLATQKFQMNRSDVYYDIHSSHSSDNGKTWSEITVQEGFARIKYKPGTDEALEAVCCDEVPAYHKKSGKFLMTGCLAFYRNNRNITDARFPLCENLSADWAETDTWYSVFDSETKKWSAPKVLTVPANSAAIFGRAGCTQRLDLEDGTILFPVYAPAQTNSESYRTVVLRCSFDGENLRYLEEGKPLELAQPRGFCEPSIAELNNRYYLTLRNDEMGYVAVSDDGLNFEEPIPWRWQKGEDGAAPGGLLGSYNTQQHWLRLGDKLYLVYTRRAENNGHIFRHRAPLFIAEFDPQTMTIIRETEQIAVPECGVSLGNFGVVAVSDKEGWVVVSEQMPSKIEEERAHKDCIQRGATGAIWITRVFAE